MTEISIDITDILSQMKDTNTLPDPNLVQFYNDLADRKIVWNDEITDDILGIADYIIQWNKEDKDVDVDKRKPIKIFISSVGGDADSTMCLADIIAISKTPVYTIGLARCFSAGGLILMSGHKRLVFPNTKFLLHDGYVGTEGSIGKFSDMSKFVEASEDKIKNFVLSKTKISEEEFDNNYRRDWYMLADDIIKYGVADEIVTDISEVL